MDLRSFSRSFLAVCAAGALVGCGGNGNNGGGGGSGGGGGPLLTSCTPAMACQVGDTSKSYQSCVGAVATDCGYKTSDGQEIACGANCDCTDAAKKLVAWCGGTPTMPTGMPVVVGACDSFSCADGSKHQICHLSDGTCSAPTAAKDRVMGNFDCAHADVAKRGVCDGQMAVLPPITSCLEVLACIEVGCTDELDKTSGGCSGRCSQALTTNTSLQQVYGKVAGCVLDECVTKSGRCDDSVAGLPPQDAAGQPAGSCVACRKAAVLPASECAGDPSCGVCYDAGQACMSN